MTLQDVRMGIAKQFEAAHELLLSTSAPSGAGVLLREIEPWYVKEDWRTVLYSLQNARQLGRLSDDLLVHLSHAEELFERYDQLGMRAALDQLTQAENRVIGECLDAAARGPFFPDWEFHTLFGVDRDEVIRAADAWPDVIEADIIVGYIINESINHLLGYPHRKEDVWGNWISVSPAQLYQVYTRFRTLTGRSDNHDAGNEEYFLNMGS